MSQLNGYKLSRKWFNYVWNHPELVTANHTALFAWYMELWNRLGQPKVFSAPAVDAMKAMGIARHATYKKCFEDLSEWGFIDIIQRSKNQFTANCICFKQNVYSNVEALDKALSEQSQSNEYSNDQSTVHIIEPQTLINHKPITLKGKILISSTGEIFEGTPIDFLQERFPSQYEVMRMQFNQIPEGEFEKAFNENYQMEGGFDTEKHCVRAAKKFYENMAKANANGSKIGGAIAANKRAHDLLNKEYENR